MRVEEDDNFGGGVLEAHTAAGLGPHSLRGSQDSNLGVPPEVLVQRLPKMLCGQRCMCAIRTAGSGGGGGGGGGRGGGDQLNWGGWEVVVVVVVVQKPLDNEWS